MKKEEKTNRKPFFARYLETQELDAIVGGGTVKYPSDKDEGNTTHKYPSDGDDGGDPI